ncbi:melatonin receptor type 1B-B-like [Dendronephthya gigantea]|uniref:melatonin receptor type 1B-B-like n=1 Tax=Dendronephthya gigantea TaxID=151771 RepID=UPI00106ADB1F|nr:melatonin receptor type 1B-B-like [Dendronephthya gigantea]
MNSTTRNGTFDLLLGNVPFKSYDVILIVIAGLIILFNGVVLFVMRKHKSLRNAQNGLLASLAISDLSSGLIGIPLVFACSFVPPRFCALCSVCYYFFKFISISTVLHILAIIGERCFTVVDPFLHRRLRAAPGRSNLILIGAIWLISLIASCVPWLWVSQIVNDCYGMETSHEGTWNPDSIYELSCFILFFILPLLLISVFLAKIFIAVHQFTRRKSRRCVDNLREQTRLRTTEKRIFVVLFSVFVLFIVCWLPYFAVTLVHVINTQLPYWVEETVPYLRSLTSLLNPFVYAFYKDDFYQALRRKLGNVRCWTRPRNSDIFTTKTKAQVPLVQIATTI